MNASNKQYMQRVISSLGVTPECIFPSLNSDGTLPQLIPELNQRSSDMKEEKKLSEDGNDIPQILAQHVGFNALVGRIGMGLSTHHILRDTLIKKIRRKLARIKKPDFLDDINVEEMLFGDMTPIFKNAKLLAISEQGDVIIETEMQYNPNSGFTMTLSTSLILDNPFTPLTNFFRSNNQEKKEKKQHRIPLKNESHYICLSRNTSIKNKAGAIMSYLGCIYQSTTHQI